jgi:hypothetical protein
MWQENHMIDFELLRSDRDVRSELMEKTDVELIKHLQSIDQSIKAGFEYAVYFQEWSIGTDILRKRGYEILRTDDIHQLAKDLEVR